MIWERVQSGGLLQIGSCQKARVILWLVKEMAVIHLARERDVWYFVGFTVILFCPVLGQNYEMGLLFLILSSDK